MESILFICFVFVSLCMVSIRWSISPRYNNNIKISREHPVLLVKSMQVIVYDIKP